MTEFPRTTPTQEQNTADQHNLDWSQDKLSPEVEKVMKDLDVTAPTAEVITGALGPDLHIGGAGFVEEEQAGEPGLASFGRDLRKVPFGDPVHSKVQEFAGSFRAPSAATGESGTVDSGDINIPHGLGVMDALRVVTNHMSGGSSKAVQFETTPVSSKTGEEYGGTGARVALGKRVIQVGSKLRTVETAVLYEPGDEGLRPVGFSATLRDASLAEQQRSIAENKRHAA